VIRLLETLPIHFEVHSIIRHIQNRVDLSMNERLKKPGFVTYDQSHSVALSLTSNFVTNNEACILIHRLGGLVLC